MPITPSFPGVYVEELAGLPLSIATGATAVPAIATSEAAFTDATRLNSWLEFIAKVGTFDKTNVLHVAVRTYFENGGGYCYVIPTTALVEQVPLYDDITLLVAAGEDIDAAVATLCIDGASLFAIKDGPKDAPGSISVEEYVANPHVAVYYPWLVANWAMTLADDESTFVDIPPSAAVAGAYCATDRDRGVWKAPANVVLQGGVKPKYKISDALQGEFNSGKALNMIREFEATGPMIWGARTLDDTDAWRYVPVRRLFNSAEKDMKRTMQSMVFEPNSQPTWERVRGAIDNYLRRLWRQGALQGNSEKEAYFVQIGLGVTMDQDDISLGKMIATVGMAAVRPAEFIILKFTQDMGAS